MAIDKIQAESINLADTFAFSGTVSGTPVGLTLLSTNTISGTSTSSVEFSNLFSSTYENYRVYIECSAVSGDAKLNLRFNKASGTISSSNYIHVKGGATRNISSDASGNTYNAGEGTEIILSGQEGINDNVLYGSSWILEIPNPLGTTSYQTAKWAMSTIANNSVNFYTFQGSGWLKDDANACTGLYFFMSSGNFKAPTKFRLYGVNV